MAMKTGTDYLSILLVENDRHDGEKYLVRANLVGTKLTSNKNFAAHDLVFADKGGDE